MKMIFAFATAIVALAVGGVQAQNLDFNPSSPIPTTNLGNLANGGFLGATTQRVPLTPREDETTVFYFRVCCQFNYDRVAVYFTTDGSDPNGTVGIPGGSTQVLTNNAGGIAFVANEFNQPGGTRDWWRATLPANTREYNQQIRYKLSRWNSNNPQTEAFNGGAFNSATAPVISHANKLAWPGQGSNFPGAEVLGYPPFHPWKEEGVVGNNYINAMLDQNGNVFDMYFPGAGGVQGVGTKNEGYVDGLDTFPAGLPSDNRGQMHLNQIITGLRVNDVTSWLSNQNGTDFVNISQRYDGDTQTLLTSQRLARGGANIDVVQYDFAPKGVGYAANGNKMVAIKRMLLTNRDAAPQTINVYLYMDPALNGGNSFDAMFTDGLRGSMVAFDNTFRVATSTGSIGFGQEYNPTTFPGYEKNVSVYLGAAMKTLAVPAAGGGARATDSWRDTSTDNGQGWIGQQVVLPPNVTVEVNFAFVGGFDQFAGATGTYDSQIGPVLDWFFASSTSGLQLQTDNFWRNFLAAGVTVDLPDERLETLFKRGILGTMLHFDEARGGLIAGFRNGAYPYVWPRDMAWAAVTLARVGQTDTVRSMTRYLRDITFREFENWNPGNTPGFAAAGGSPFYGTRKGFWKQKYTTDGFVVWGAPQVDETAVIPWMVYYQYLLTGDLAYLNESTPGNPANTTYAIVKDAAIAMSQTSVIDGGRLNHRAAFPGSPTFLMYSNNVWEDSYDTFIFSNASIVRGLRDAATLANLVGQPGDAADFNHRASGVTAGLDAKLDWNRENTDVSLLGIVYPFYIYAPNDPRAARIIDRINGVAANGNGQVQPLVRFANEYINNTSDFVGLVDRYWGDSYWGNNALGPTPAGPWFLTTLWYGSYYALRQNHTPGTGDIDNHLYRVNRAADHNGPVGFGAEQMAPSNSLLYPGQSDFSLQTAWPNAWESMSFYVDSLMLFLDFTPNAPGNELVVRPKLPSAWPTMTFNGLKLGDDPTQPSRNHRFNVTVSPGDFPGGQHIITNVTGHAGARFDTVIRIPANAQFCRVLVNGETVTPTSVDAALGAVRVRGDIAAGVNSLTVIRVDIACPLVCFVDFNKDGFLNQEDLSGFLTTFLDESVPAGPTGTNAAPCPGEPAPYDQLGYAADYNRDCTFNQEDLAGYITEYFLESEMPTNCIPG